MKKNNFIYLLFALTVYLVVLPILEDLNLVPDAIARPVSMTCLLAIGVWSLRESVTTFRIGMALALVGIASNGMGVANDATAFHYLSVAALFAFLVLAIGSALRRILISSKIDANRLYGALCVYLMLGVLWALMYSALESLDPGAFSGAIPAATEERSLAWLYYSFVTLTTLGYGDILPVTATARALAYAEAVIGVYYMAVLVATLVGSYAAAGKDNNQ